MSTNYTQNYALCQWEPDDQVLRTDFNADNAKLETALTRIETTADAAKDAAQAAQATADAAWSPEQPYIFTGTYTGNGAGSRDIELGFRPRAVVVGMSSGAPMATGPYSGSFIVYGGLATEQCGCGRAVVITDTGFRVYFDNGTYRANIANQGYNYIAFR